VLSESALWRTVEAHNSYKAAIAVAQHSFPSLSNVSPDNLVFRAEVRGPTGTGIVEISSDTWYLLLQSMNFVTIELKQGSGMFR
jgi:hypothetical protein